MPRLTERSVANAKPDPNRRIELWDDLVTGFGLRITPAGHKSFVVMYRMGGRLSPKRRLTLGSYPRIGLGDARQMAKDALEKVAKGIDPSVGDEKGSVEGRLTFGKLADLYLEKEAHPNKRTSKEEERQINKDLRPEWGSRAAADITREDVVGVLQAVAERGPIAANRLKSLTSSIFNWGMTYDDPETKRPLLTTSPVVNIAPFAPEESRTRVLDDWEIKAIWEALPEVNATYQRFIKSLFLTVQRRDEVARLQLSQTEEVDWHEWGYAGPIWTVPGPVAKNGVPNVVPLIDEAWKLINVPGAEYVFPAKNKKGRPISGFSKAKRAIDKKCKVEDWRLHDIRRTASTKMAELKIEPHVVERLLNHTTGQLGGVAGIYNRFQYVREKREALQRWASFLSTKLKLAL